MGVRIDTRQPGAAEKERREEGGDQGVQPRAQRRRPVRSGRVRTEARLVNLTRSLGYAEGEIRSAEGKLLARASGTFFLTETLEQSERERV